MKVHWRQFVTLEASLFEGILEGPLISMLMAHGLDKGGTNESLPLSQWTCGTKNGSNSSSSRGNKRLIVKVTTKTKLHQVIFPRASELAVWKISACFSSSSSRYFSEMIASLSLCCFVPPVNNYHNHHTNQDKNNSQIGYPYFFISKSFLGNPKIHITPEFFQDST